MQSIVQFELLLNIHQNSMIGNYIRDCCHESRIIIKSGYDFETIQYIIKSLFVMKFVSCLQRQRNVLNI